MGKIVIYPNPNSIMKGGLILQPSGSQLLAGVIKCPLLKEYWKYRGNFVLYILISPYFDYILRWNDILDGLLSHYVSEGGPMSRMKTWSRTDGWIVQDQYNMLFPLKANIFSVLSNLIWAVWQINFQISGHRKDPRPIILAEAYLNNSLNL